MSGVPARMCCGRRKLDVAARRVRPNSSLSHVEAVRNRETRFRVRGASEPETLVEGYRGCIADVNKQRALSDAQRLFSLSQQHPDELRAETPAAIGRRNGQAAEVASPDTQVELAKPT